MDKLKSRRNKKKWEGINPKSWAGRKRRAGNQRAQSTSDLCRMTTAFNWRARVLLCRMLARDRPFYSAVTVF